MAVRREQYITDRTGRTIGVFFDIEEYRRILGELEELEALRAFDAAQASGDEVIPLDQAIREIERRTLTLPSPGVPGEGTQQGGSDVEGVT